MTDTAAQLIWAVGALVLVLSSLAARRLPLGQTLRLVLAWIAIFAAAFVLVMLWYEEGTIRDRAAAGPMRERAADVSAVSDSFTVLLKTANETVEAQHAQIESL